MKRFRKLLLWGLISIVLIIIIAIGAITLFFPKEKIKQMAIEKISSNLDRQVTIDDISVSFFGGLGAWLEGIKIENPDGFEEPYFLQAEALDIKLQFWPLLKKQVLIDKLILVEPKIILHKLPDGKINYQFGVVDEHTPQTVEEKLPEESKVALAAISFDKMAIKNGRCDFMDDSAGMSISAIGIATESRLQSSEDMKYHAFGNIGIDSLLITTDSMVFPKLIAGMDYDVVYDMNKNSVKLSNLDININGIDARITGKIPNLETFNSSSMEIKSRQIAVADVLTFLTDEQKILLKDYDINGNLSLNASVAYDNTTEDTLLYDGNINLNDIKLSLNDIAGLFAIDSANVEFKKDDVNINLYKASFESSQFQGSLTISDFENPLVKGRFKGNANLTMLNPYLPKPGQPKLAGDMKFNISFYGLIENIPRMQVSGGLTIKNGSYTATTLPEPIQSFELDVTIDSRDITIKKMDVKFPASDINLTGTMANAFPYFIPGYENESHKPTLSFEMKSQRFDVDKLFPEAVPGEGVNPTEIPVDSLPPIILPDINGRGSGRIDTMIYAKVEFTDISSDIIIKDRKIYVENANGNVYTGKVTGETTVDLNDFERPKYSGKFDGKKIEANDFLTRFTGFGGHLFGKLDVTGSFSAEGWEPDSIMDNLFMEGDAYIHEAKLVNFDMIKKLADQAKIKTFDEEEIKDLSTSYQVKDGRVSFEELQLFTKFGDWKLTGSAGFDGSLDYRGEVLLSEKTSNDMISKSGLLSSLAGMLKQKGTDRINIPFTLGGTYSSPKFGLDLSLKKMAEDKAKDDLKDKATDALKNLFKKK